MSAPAAPAVASRTVLVVDDYPAVLAWATRAFARAGWAVLTATDGTEALARWAEARAAGTPVRALVTDLELPGLDGATLARRLREADPALPVLAMHAAGCGGPCGGPDDAGAGGRADAAWHGPLLDRTAFFEKPVRAAQLVATAEALVVAEADGGAADGGDDPFPRELPRPPLAP